MNKKVTVSECIKELNTNFENDKQEMQETKEEN